MGIKYSINEKFFEKWSSDMAYILGYIYADGNLNNSPNIRAKYIQITSTDEDSIKRIKKWLNSEHKITKERSFFIGSKLCFKLRIGSHKMYNDLSKFGLHPNKSLSIRFPIIPEKYLGHFIRGYFDGDGCIYFEKRKNVNGIKIIKRIRIIFTSGSISFLKTMNKILKNKINVNGKIYQSKRSFQSIYNTKDSLEIFKIMYKNTKIDSFFMRKFRIFKEYLELRPTRIDATIRKILCFNNTGHVVK